MKDWKIQDNEVIPIDDILEHSKAEDCACKPMFTRDGVLIHNSFDKRELYEQSIN